MAVTSATADDRWFFGHPRPLAFLAFTEAWERFSYYGMRALLLYYMTDQVLNGGLDIPTGTAIRCRITNLERR